jgi:hypothetical protein
VAKPAQGSLLRRYLALTDLCASRLRALGGVRVARAFGWMIAAGFAVAMLAAASEADPSVLNTLAVQALSWLSWLTAGLATLSLARDIARRDEQDGIAILAQQRGVEPAALAVARLLATIRVLFRATAPQALTLALLALALSKSVPTAVGRGLLCVGVGAYVALLAVVLAATARWASALSPARGRSVAVALLLGPHLARSVWPSVPSVVAWFESLLRELERIGGSLG